MNPLRIFDVFRKGHEFADAVKSGKQAAIVAALGALLACVAPFLGSQINAHPVIAFFFSQDGIQLVGAVVTGIAGLVYHFGSSAERGIPGLPAKPEPEPAPAPAAESDLSAGRG